MALITVYHTWSDGYIAAGLISADRLNTNFSRLYDLVNGALDGGNFASPLGFEQHIQMTDGDELRFIESGATETQYVGFKAPASIAANVIWTLPSADGSAGQVLTTDGAGTWSWAAAGGAASDHGLLSGLTDDDHTQYSLFAFKTIAIAGQSDVVADARDDTLTIVAGSNVTLTTTADQITIAASSTIPAGVICMWHGLITNIPSGWTLCDGTSSTPDLREKFVKGAASGVEAGDTGGAATHTHTAHTALTHSGTAVAAHSVLTHAEITVAAHTGLTHSVTQPATHVFSQDGASGSAEYVASAATYAHTDTAVAAHGTAGSVTHTAFTPASHTLSSHSVTQPSSHSISAHSTVNSEPAYYTVLFIMKTA